MPKSNAQFINTRLDGLSTHGNAFSEVSRGALEEAINTVLRRPSLAQPRRGFVDISNRGSTGSPNFSLSGLGTGSSDRVSGIFEYQDVILVAMENGGLFFYDNDIATWRSVDNDSTVPLNPDPTNGYFIETNKQNRNFYYTSREGVRKLDTVDRGVAKDVGSPQALDGTASLSGSSGFLEDDTAVAYRIVWGYIDLNNNLILGAPSQRIIVTNSSGADQSVDLQFTIPVGITDEYFYQVYRSDPSASATAEPDDNMQLVAENNPSAGELTAKEVTITDELPDTLRGDALYTNANQEGILQANSEPPAALLLEDFRNHLFYGAAVPKATLNIQLIAVGGSDGIVNGDQVEVYIGDGTSPASSTVFTGASSENAAANQFEVVTSGTPGQNIQDTATSLVRVMNKRFSTEGDDVAAFYNRDPNAFPGQIAMIGGTGNFQYRRFAFGVSRPSSWLNSDQYKASQGAVSLVTAYGSLALVNFDSNMSLNYVNAITTIQANRLYYSKFSEPEAVPTVNFFDVGSASDPIVRIIASRDALYVFKREEGIFRLHGDVVGTFRIDQLDETVRIIGPRSAVNIANQIYCFSDQGVVSVGTSDVIVQSEPIENTLREIVGKSENASYLNRIYAIGYETEREYILALPDGAPTGDEGLLPTQFVYNIFTNAWTQWDVRQDTAAVINNQIYVGKKNRDGDNTLFLERKTYTEFDYADEEGQLVVSSVSVGDTETTLTVSNSDTVLVGWKVSQTVNNITAKGEITSIPDSTTVVVENPTLGAFTTGTYYGYQPYRVTIEWVDEDCDNMAMIKRFNEFLFTFEGANFPEGDAFFRTSASSGFFRASLVPRLGEVGVGWGQFAWGQVPWGGTTAQNITQPIRVLPPPSVRVGQWISVRVQFNEALAEWALAGYSMFYKPISPRLRR